MAVKPVATEPDRQVIEVNTGNHPFRQQANQREIHCADQGQPLQNAADVFAGVAARTNARNEAAVLAHVVGKFSRIENDADIEKREQQDHGDVEHGVKRFTPFYSVGKSS